MGVGPEPKPLARGCVGLWPQVDASMTGPLPSRILQPLPCVRRPHSPCCHFRGSAFGRRGRRRPRLPAQASQLPPHLRTQALASSVKDKLPSQLSQDSSRCLDSSGGGQPPFSGQRQGFSSRVGFAWGLPSISDCPQAVKSYGSLGGEPPKDLEGSLQEPLPWASAPSPLPSTHMTWNELFSFKKKNP